MGSEIFVDTGGFYAMLVPRDRMHRRAREFMAQAIQERRRFVTTDHVLDECATLLRTRGHDRFTADLFESVENSRAIRIEWTTSDRFHQTRAFFLRHADKAWSFTDCLSFVVMRALGLREALSTDNHFRQAGFMLILDNPHSQVHDPPPEFGAEPEGSPPQSSNRT
ncbi:MAG: type II toxin-antitoxin system VapC family toxin [Gammaproteobacteria bacterium]|nr:type II toxin-antitoxin system VapC family toxin [Gammaproteobacteria bacterium]MYK05828.1 type II toxin-antitoxin system VapC family toxin [Gammaproteobacteria bacterium]